MVNFLGRSLTRPHTRDYCAGALMMLIGLGAVSQGFNYEVGSLTQMGAGFFPVALGVILMLLGVVLVCGARRKSIAAEKSAGAEHGAPQWRGWIAILASIVAFVVLGKYGGLLPASFAIVFISALGDRENTVKSAFILAASISAICVVVFWWALQLQFPLFTWG